VLRPRSGHPKRTPMPSGGRRPCGRGVWIGRWCLAGTGPRSRASCCSDRIGRVRDHGGVSGVHPAVLHRARCSYAWRFADPDALADVPGLRAGELPFADGIWGVALKGLPAPHRRGATRGVGGLDVQACRQLVAVGGACGAAAPPLPAAMGALPPITIGPRLRLTPTIQHSSRRPRHAVGLLLR
jgi:hypothetical protein